MYLALLDHVVPAMQRQLAGIHLLTHHRVTHEPLELQHHGALFSASKRFRADLHRQHGFAAQFQPGGEVFGLRQHFVVQRADAAAVAVAADHNARNLQIQNGKFDRCRGAVVTGTAVVGRHKRPHVANDEQLAWAGARQQVGHQARVRAADEQDGRVLAVTHQILELLLHARKSMVMKAAQPQ